MHQITRDMSSALFGTVPAALANKRAVWGFGSKLDASITTWYFGYTNSHLDMANYKNQADHAGVKVLISGALNFIGTVQYDRMKYLDANNKRLTTANMLDYVFGKHTDAYAEVDYTRLQGAWVALNGAVAFNNPGNMYGDNLQLGVMLGVWYKLRLLGSLSQ